MFKIVLVGDSGVGKSSILLRFADDTFTESYISTIGVDFRFKTIEVDGKVAKLQIWDTAGQERFKTITSAYYRGADGVFLVFDKTNSGSFEHISTWLEEINRFSESTAKVLVGNKDDVEDAVEVSESQAVDYAEKHSMKYIETSALSAHQVVDAFQVMTHELIERRTQNQPKGKKLGPAKVKSNDCCSK